MTTRTSRPASRTLKCDPTFPDRSGRSSTPGSTARRSTRITTTNTGTPESACSPRHQSTTAPPHRSVNNDNEPATPPEPRTRNGSAAAAAHNRPASQTGHGSTNPTTATPNRPPSRLRPANQQRKAKQNQEAVSLDLTGSGNTSIGYHRTNGATNIAEAT